MTVPFAPLGALTALGALGAIAAASWLLPVLDQPTLAFGVRVPAGAGPAPTIAAERQRYRRGIASASAVAAAAGAVALVTGWWWLMVAGALVLGGATALAWSRAHRAIVAAKQREGWYAGLRQATVVDTSLRTRPEPFPWRWAAPAVIVVVATTVAGIVRYPALPEVLALHVGVGGTAGARVARSVPAAFSPVAVQVLLTAVLIGVARAGFGARADLDPADPAASGARHRRFVVGLVRRLLVLVACLDAVLAVAAWVVWSDRPSPLAVVLVAVAVAAGVVPLVAFALRAGQGGHRLPAREAPRPGAVHRDDDSHWRLGVVYVNPADPAVMVPQRVGVGWTVNLGRPLAQLALGTALCLPPAVVVALLVLR